MILHSETSSVEIREFIKVGIIVLGGNKKLKIYGLLNCKSGKRMQKQNRVFFSSENEAKELGYRPCGNCMREKYKEWKGKNSLNGFI